MGSGAVGRYHFSDKILFTQIWYWPTIWSGAVGWYHLSDNTIYANMVPADHGEWCDRLVPVQ